jgi:nucleotide-binding universal stress UspA family protein
VEAKIDRLADKETSMIRKLILATDLSENSVHAVRLSLTLVRRFGAIPVVVYVVEFAPPSGAFPSEFEQSGEFQTIEKIGLARAARSLDDFLKRFETQHISFERRVRRGKPFVQIIQAAREENADLIVIGTHGHTDIQHFLIGSTAERVVRKAHCPVMVVKPKETADADRRTRTEPAVL